MISTPKPREAAWLWLLKIITGVLVIVLIFVHIIVNHLVATGGLMTYADVVRYLSNPWIGFMESVFLVIVVTHSLIGTRSVVLDLNPSEKVLRVLDGLFVLIGITAIVYGIVLLRIIVSQGAGA